MIPSMSGKVLVHGKLVHLQGLTCSLVSLVPKVLHNVVHFFHFERMILHDCTRMCVSKDLMLKLSY